MSLPSPTLHYSQYILYILYIHCKSVSALYTRNVSIQLLPHTYIHLQVEGTDFIFGKRHETGCSDIHDVIWSLSKTSSTSPCSHTINTNTGHMLIILYALMILLASKYLVSLTILVSLYHFPENQPQL